MSMLAKSLSGHDKGQYYVIVREEKEYVYLADGRNRSVLAPKKKNRKHIQIVKNLPEELRDLITQPLSDTEVKRVLKLWRKSQDA